MDAVGLLGAQHRARTMSVLELQERVFTGLADNERSLQKLREQQDAIRVL